MLARALLLIGIPAAGVLAGCATSDDSAGRFFVQPERYQLYSCRELAEAAQAIGTRERELEGLMAKAGPDASGQFVSTIAYRPEYHLASREVHFMHTGDQHGGGAVRFAV